jgi:hypothetical protein
VPDRLNDRHFAIPRGISLEKMLAIYENPFPDAANNRFHEP